MIDSVKHKRNSEFHWISNLRLKVFLKIYFWSFKERNVFSHFWLSQRLITHGLPWRNPTFQAALQAPHIHRAYTHHEPSYCSQTPYRTFPYTSHSNGQSYCADNRCTHPLPRQCVSWDLYLGSDYKCSYRHDHYTRTWCRGWRYLDHLVKMACCCIGTCNDDTEKKKLRLILVITKGYGVRATTIEGQNAFAPTMCFA